LHAPAHSFKPKATKVIIQQDAAAAAVAAAAAAGYDARLARALLTMPQFEGHAAEVCATSILLIHCSLNAPAPPVPQTYIPHHLNCACWRAAAAAAILQLLRAAVGWIQRERAHSELSIMMLVGLPNSGKSSLINALKVSAKAAGACLV
jgi:hypothetical protein